MAAKIAAPRTELAEDVARDINETEARIREAVPIAQVIYIEPDIRRASTEPAPDWSSDQQPSPATEPASGS